MITKILYNLRTCIVERELVLIVTCRRKCINIMKFSNSFLAELAEMNSCVYHVETANDGMGM